MKHLSVPETLQPIVSMRHHEQLKKHGFLFVFNAFSGVDMPCCRYRRSRRRLPPAPHGATPLTISAQALSSHNTPTLPSARPERLRGEEDIAECAVQLRSWNEETRFGVVEGVGSGLVWWAARKGGIEGMRR